MKLVLGFIIFNFCSSLVIKRNKQILNNEDLEIEQCHIRKESVYVSFSKKENCIDTLNPILNFEIQEMAFNINLRKPLPGQIPTNGQSYFEHGTITLQSENQKFFCLVLVLPKKNNKKIKDKTVELEMKRGWVIEFSDQDRCKKIHSKGIPLIVSKDDNSLTSILKYISSNVIEPNSKELYNYIHINDKRIYNLKKFLENTLYSRGMNCFLFVLKVAKLISKNDKDESDEIEKNITQAIEQSAHTILKELGREH